MKNTIQDLTIYERARVFANYIVANKTTIRATAKEYEVSKSTVHTNITKQLNGDTLYDEVREVLDVNIQERHIRGGEATKRKYLSLQ